MVQIVVPPMELQTSSAPWDLSLAPPLGTLCSVKCHTEKGQCVHWEVDHTWEGSRLPFYLKKEVMSFGSLSVSLALYHSSQLVFIY